MWIRLALWDWVMWKLSEAEAKSETWGVGSFLVVKHDNSIHLMQDFWPMNAWFKKLTHSLSTIENIFVNNAIFWWVTKIVCTWVMCPCHYVSECGKYCESSRVGTLWEPHSTTGYLANYRYFSTVDAVVICRHIFWSHNLHWWPTLLFKWHFWGLFRSHWYNPNMLKDCRNTDQCKKD